MSDDDVSPVPKEGLDPSTSGSKINADGNESIVDPCSLSRSEADQFLQNLILSPSPSPEREVCADELEDGEILSDNDQKEKEGDGDLTTNVVATTDQKQSFEADNKVDGNGSQEKAHVRSATIPTLSQGSIPVHEVNAKQPLGDVKTVTDSGKKKEEFPIGKNNNDNKQLPRRSIPSVASVSPIHNSSGHRSPSLNDKSSASNSRHNESTEGTAPANSRIRRVHAYARNNPPYPDPATLRRSARTRTSTKPFDIGNVNKKSY